MQEAMKEHNFSITEFTVAPQANPEDNALPYHEWLIEFDQPPVDIEAVAKSIDSHMQGQNSYYFDLISGKILQPLRIKILKKGQF